MSNKGLDKVSSPERLPKLALEKAFNELMPEVIFVDVTEKVDESHKNSGKRLGRSILSDKNFLADKSKKQLKDKKSEGRVE